MIHDLATPFPFDTLLLSTPYNKGGFYFIKMSLNDNPIYIQSPKCFLKSGMIKTGKKMFCDIVFSNEHERLIGWLEGLEETCKKHIFENRTKWFENDLDEHDIENYLTSPYKIIKSGKQYVMRVNVPTLLDKCELKIYNENEMEVSAEDLKENTNVVTILEFKGIRCSVRSFQFEIELKQMLVVAPVKMFEKCVIHVDKAPANATATPNVHVPAPTMECISDLPDHTNTDVDTKNTPTNTDTNTNTNTINMDTETPHRSMNGLVEVDDFEIDSVDYTETVQLRKRDDVYYKMYKEAKRKAKEAKILALSNYLEAKRIKSTYLLNDEISEDDNEDADLDTEMKQLSVQL